MQILIKILYIILVIVAFISLYLMNDDSMNNMANLFFTIAIALMIVISYLKGKTG